MSAARTEPVATRGRILCVVTLLVLGLGGMAASAIGWWLDPPPGTSRLEAVWSLSWPGLALVGATIAIRRPSNRVGWALLAIGTGIGLGLGASAGLATVSGTDPSLVLTVLLVAERVGFAVGFGTLPLLLLYYPSGHVESPLRWLERATVGLVALVVVVRLLETPLPLPDGRMVANPLSITALEPAILPTIVVLSWLLVGCGAASVIVALRGWRRATGVERLQRRWFGVSAIAFVLLFATGVIVEGLISPQAATPAILAAWILGMNGIAGAIGIAILRYRLYEIDRVISRTVTYGLVTAVLVGVYALIAVVPAALFDLESDLLVAAATLVAAAAFGPLRRRVQGGVDRRFNRSRYDATRVADRFAIRLRDEVDLDDLVGDLRGVVADTVQPTSVSLWLRRTEQQP